MAPPTTNRKLTYSVPASDLDLIEEELPPLLANEILIKVHAAAINPVDTQLWRSQLTAVVKVPGGKGMGRDFSGTVVEVGTAVRDWAIGEDIFGLYFQALGNGTFSEYISLNPSSEPVAKKPASLSHEDAASLPLVALTAFACLEWLPVPTTSQRRVIVRGASGGTGSWVVQLAKEVYDCHVTAICSGKNSEYVRKLGADEIIDYGTQPVPETLLKTKEKLAREYDLLVDCVGGTELLEAHSTFLHNKGGYITIVGDKTSVQTLGGPITYLTNPAMILRYIRGYIWGPRYACISFSTQSSYLTKVVSLAERAELRIEIQEVIRDTFDGGWRRAIELIESARVRGKVVLLIP
ncbi:zinc-dependent acohol dehydrogenase (reticulon-4-interacting protein 1) [Phlyctema vagabunda]|uniref:Zinc-dependent acohol dehydrogenase (Reticulon-4-interacting protein 1) n=1 Tax=Phlyctema vagabunda TaxID=108571 RepID=A0ABR4PPY3_9HELO